MISGLTAGSRRYRSAVLAELLGAQRQLDDAKSRLSEAQAKRDRYVALSVRAGFSHTEVARSIGLERSAVSQLLRRKPGLARAPQPGVARNGLELLNPRTAQRQP